jgi:hypothetical protein
MSNLMIPGPGGAEPEKTGDEDTHGSSRDNGSARGRQQCHPPKPSIPSPEDCLRAFAQIAGLVAMGILKPAGANAIRSAYREILQHHKAKAKEAEKSLTNADVMDLLRKDPKLLNLLAPLLTSEQLDMVMNAGNEGADEQA